MADAASTIPPELSEPLEDLTESVEFRVSRIALVLESRALLDLSRRALGARAVLVVGREMLGLASVVLLEVRPQDAKAQIAEVRAAAPPDVAIVAVLAAPSTTCAVSLAAGAFACLHYPFEEEELQGVVARALDARAARVQAADLVRKLDLQSHLASIGRLSGALAHELANPLAAATSNTEVAAALLAEIDTTSGLDVEGVQSRVREARAALADALSAHSVVRELLELTRGLARKKAPDLVPLEMVRAVETTLDLLTPTQARPWIERMLARDVVVRGDALLIRQIVTNLVSNAVRAAESLPSPRVRVHLYRSGAWGVVSVRDNGPGVAAEDQERIFEPFFTRNRDQGGLGLGLALCREYALQMKARLSLASIPGRGACFRLHVPIA